LPVYRRGGKGKREAENIREYPACRELAEHLIRYLTDHEFDVASSSKLRPGVGLGHAFTFLYDQMGLDGSIPTIPLMVNTFYPPNQPTPKRCYALGQAVRTAIEAWPEGKRVAVMGSGGLSHTIIDEEIDHIMLDGMLEKDAERLCSLPVERLTLGTSENRNWIAEAGAMEPLPMTLIGYEPCYRSPAGTGCAIAFAYWK
jgi:aromatic ring-opening dioxygenase catalytic subunit (LigB family)